MRLFLTLYNISPITFYCYGKRFVVVTVFYRGCAFTLRKSTSKKFCGSDDLPQCLRNRVCRMALMGTNAAFVGVMVLFGTLSTLIIWYAWDVLLFTERIIFLSVWDHRTFHLTVVVNNQSCGSIYWIRLINVFACGRFDTCDRSSHIT